MKPKDSNLDRWCDKHPLNERVGPIRMETKLDASGKIIQREVDATAKSIVERICDVRDRQMETKLAELGFVHSGECQWHHDEEYWYWETDCGNTHEFISSGPRDNKYKFCPYCGGRMIERTHNGTEEEE